MLLNLAVDIFFIVFLFTLFGYIHTWLASNKIKRFVVSKIGNKIAFYRLFYNISSLILLYFIFRLMPKPDLTIYDLPNPYDLLILIPQILGLAGFFWTFKYFSLSEFAGITQVNEWRRGEYNISELDERLTLKIEGPYRFVRHPLYFFSIVFLIFRSTMDLFYLTLLICIIVYFYLGSVYEEKKLVEKFGEEYIKYQQAVPRLITFRLFHL